MTNAEFAVAFFESKDERDEALVIATANQVAGRMQRVKDFSEDKKKRIQFAKAAIADLQNMINDLSGMYDGDFERDGF